MPSHVLNNGGVAGEDVLGINNPMLLGCGIDVPQADGVIIRG